MTIKNKIQLQKALMLNSKFFWNVNDLTDVMRSECKTRGFASINHSTVERNIRSFREPRHALVVEKKKVSKNTYEYKISHAED